MTTVVRLLSNLNPYINESLPGFSAALLVYLSLKVVSKLKTA